MSKPDNNLHSIANRRPLGDVYLGDLIADPAVHADALKITNCADGRVFVGRIVGGAEDCIDLNNHCENLEIVAESIEPRGKYGVTNKGGNRNITICTKLRGHGSEVDVDLGNVSDQSDDVTGPTKLYIEHELGPQEPVRTRNLNATRPIILNPAQRYETIFAVPGFFRSLFSKIYKQLKKLFPI